MSAPAIYLSGDPGQNNRDLDTARERMSREGAYRDSSTVIVTPAIGPIPVRVVHSWMTLLRPMNQKIAHTFVENMEIGAAYSSAFDAIINHPDLSSWKYILTMETDNCPPPDGLIKLLADIESGPTYAAVGSLYWTKGEDGRPMCFGKPEEGNMRPWLPDNETVSECLGLGMGFTLFRMEMFKDPRMKRPFFETIQEYIPEYGVNTSTQDLNFFMAAGKLGYRFACSTRVLTGHWDDKTKVLW